MAKKKIVKAEEMTVDQFKIWIRGMETFMPDTWEPDSNQWALIRATIDKLIEHDNSAQTTESDYSNHNELGFYQNTPPVSQNVHRRQSAMAPSGKSTLDYAASRAPIEGSDVSSLPKRGPSDPSGLSSHDTGSMFDDTGAKDGFNLS